MAVKSHIITGLTLRLKPTAAASSSSGTGSSLCLVKKPLTSSFFNGGVASLKTSSIRILPGRSHCYRQGGGALGTRMNLFDGLLELLSSFENPEKILDQAVLKMNDDLVLASQKRLENKYKAAQQASEDRYRKAQLALQKGEEDLAREALKRCKSLAQDNANSLKEKSKKDTLKAQAQSARTATKVNEMVGNVNTSSALVAFEKMEEKVLAMESEAEALGQLTTDDLDGKVLTTRFLFLQSLNPV
ncbi:Membrane-associated 30 kDa protein [Hibiscus syriacus]|uniref:Membrane-associated 30 kDa protein n=1 Tax=Hibiscus syriacus TaxID=106335 RepID=A0A6A2X627_HIBSY|nr:Membrane-associated 30 kDa protein [Hibiscus syriacus]